jgi:hypothetical protein
MHVHLTIELLGFARCLLELSNPWCVQDLNFMKSLGLRYFTPREVANLLGFPNERFRYVCKPPPCVVLTSKAASSFFSRAESRHQDLHAVLLENSSICHI